MRPSPVASALALCALVSSALAQQQTQFTTTIPGAPVPGNNTVQIPRFDAALGVLRTVQLTLSGSVSGTLGFENTTAVPTNAPPYNVGAMLTGTFAGGGFVPPPNPAFEFATPPPLPPVPLAAFDGVVDFAGTSGVTMPFTNQTGTGMPSMSYFVTQDAAVGTWVGPAGAPGILLATIEAFPGNSGILPVGIQSTHTVTVTITLTVTCTYDTLPAPICRTFPNSGCPCNNHSTINAGCANSVSALGGFLTVTGPVASITNDQVQLQAGQMPPQSPVLYFQGTSFSHAQTVLGNGLLCVNGTITRLAVKFNGATGTSGFPVLSDPPLHSAGLVFTTGTRYYQAHYRDALAVCTGATSNLTNGMAVLWAP